MSDRMRISEFHESEGVQDWRVLSDGAFSFFRTASFAESARFVEAVAGLDGVAEHPPAVDIRRDGVTVRLITVEDDYMGMTALDVELARRISAAARELGLAPDPRGVQSMIVIPGWTDSAEIMPFWEAVLGYEPRADSPEEDLVDPHDRGVPFWFERMRAARPDGGGAVHVGVFVPPEEAERRIAAALAAGGRMVRDQFAPSWWTLADAAGNEADIATTQGRD